MGNFGVFRNELTIQVVFGPVLRWRGILFEVHSETFHGANRIHDRVHLQLNLP